MDEIIEASLRLTPSERADVIEALSLSILLDAFSDLNGSAREELDTELDRRVAVFERGDYLDASAALDQLCAWWRLPRGSG